MKFPLPEVPFGPILLTWKERQMFLQLGQRLLKQDLQDYEATCAQNGGRAPGIANLHKDQWQMIMQRENVAVFKEVTPKTSASSSSATTSSNQHYYHHKKKRSYGLHSRSRVGSGPNNFFPLLQAVGTIAGSLDDVMYGMMTGSDASTRIKSTYVGDNIVDSRILYELDPPSEDEPFHFIGINWHVKTSSPAFVRPRDFVFLQTTGVTKLACSEDRIGYYLMHSIDLEQCPPLDDKFGFCRGQVFSSYLFREIAPNKVQVTMRCITGPKGKILESLGVHSAANGLMGNFQSVYCAQMKKLTWFVIQNHQQGLIEADSGSRNGSNLNTNGPGFDGGIGGSGGITLEDVRLDEEDVFGGDDSATLSRHQRSVSSLSFSHHPNSGNFVCGSCRRGFHVFFAATSCVCRICLQETCKRCLITKRLSFEIQNHRYKKIKQKRLKFCKACITKSNKWSSLQIAQQEIRQRDDPFLMAEMEFSTTNATSTSTNTNLPSHQGQQTCSTTTNFSLHNSGYKNPARSTSTHPPVDARPPRRFRAAPPEQRLVTPDELDEDVDDEFDTCDMQRVLPTIQQPPPPPPPIPQPVGCHKYQPQTPASMEAMCDQIHELLRTTEKTFQWLNHNKQHMGSEQIQSHHPLARYK